MRLVFQQRKRRKLFKEIKVLKKALEISWYKAFITALHIKYGHVAIVFTTETDFASVRKIDSINYQLMPYYNTTISVVDPPNAFSPSRAIYKHLFNTNTVFDFGLYMSINEGWADSKLNFYKSTNFDI